MLSAERPWKVRGIMLLTGLLRDSDIEACKVNRQVTILKSREAELRHSNKQILDVTEDEAGHQELEVAAHYREKIMYAIAEGQSFLNEYGQSLYLCSTCCSTFDYVIDASKNYE